MCAHELGWRADIKDYWLLATATTKAIEPSPHPGAHAIFFESRNLQELQLQAYWATDPDSTRPLALPPPLLSCPTRAHTSTAITHHDGNSLALRAARIRALEGDGLGQAGRCLRRWAQKV